MNNDKKQQITNQIHALSNSLKIIHLNIDESLSLVTLIIQTETPSLTSDKQLSRQIAKIIKIDNQYKGLKLQIEPSPKSQSSSKKTPKYITITSGKGGVGKSTVSANLAAALARFGYKIAIIDADIYGPTIPQLFQIDNAEIKTNSEQKIIPIAKEGVDIISTQLLQGDDKPLMWRGPMLKKMLQHFFDDVAWNPDLDYIIIDLPPGTGDVPIDIKDLIPNAHAIVVTTPNKIASNIAIKSGLMAKSLGHNLLGIIENMSYYQNPANGQHEKIFGSGGAKLAAKKLNTKILAEIPITQTKEEFTGGIFTPHEETGLNYLGLANQIIKILKEETT